MSSYEEDTTEPNSPVSLVNEDTQVIARLFPLTPSTRRILDLTAQRGNPHHQKFIKRAKFHGESSLCFEISLNNRPEYPALGWRIGRGRTKDRNYGVDLLLPNAEGVAGYHGRMAYLRGIGGFFLLCDNSRAKPIYVNNNVLRNSQSVIPLDSTITIGDCTFGFEYVKRSQQDEDSFLLKLKDFHHDTYADELPIILATPSVNDMILGEWVVQHSISKGSYGTVFSVSHKQTGVVAAAKLIMKTQQNANVVQREIRMLKQLMDIKHNNVASPFDIIENRHRNAAEELRIRGLLDNSWTTNPRDSIGDYLVLSPLATATFENLFTSGVSVTNKISFFTQLLTGLAFLHSNNIFHRDIKPANILVDRYDPPTARITDFGCAVTEEPIYYDRPGTILYLAPEQQEGTFHSREVDYWACGLVGMQLLGLQKPRQRTVPGSRLDEILQQLDDIQDEESRTMASICRRMLTLEVESRLAPQSALVLLSGYSRKIEQEENQTLSAEVKSQRYSKRTRKNQT